MDRRSVGVVLGFALVACGETGTASTGSSGSSGAAGSSGVTGSSSGSGEPTGEATTGEPTSTTGTGTSGEPPTGTAGTSAADPLCGDGVVDPGEDCDDGDAEPLDGCDACKAGYVPDPVTLGMDLPAVVPVLRIDVGGQEIEKDIDIAGHLEVFAEHDGTLTDLDGRTPSLSTPIGFQGRGNFTWTLPKRGYAFELQDDAGEDLDAAILGLPAGSDFALYACYTDKTCMRNALVSALGQELGRWNPRARYVELIVDGEYLGLYMLWERIRRDETRVDVDKPAPTAADGDLEGGYILRHEGGGKGPEVKDGITYERDFTVASGLVYTYHYPDADKITPQQSAYLQGLMQDVEAAIVDDPAAHAQWIDVDSWVDQAIVEEYTNNWDGYVHSVYMRKQSLADGGLLGMGPLWDFDLAFANGNVTGYNCQTDVWAHENVRPAPDDMPAYWLALFAEPAFQERFKCRWQALREGPIELATFDARVEAWTEFTADARARDQERWGTVGQMLFPNCFSAPDFEGEVEALRGWISARIEWIDGQVAQMPGTCG